MKKYRTILADPPWFYRQRLGRGKRAGDSTRGGLPYPALTVEEIMKLPVNKITDKDCMLFLWTTNAHIHDALHVMKSWGFTYKTMITWAKHHFGLGYWFRGQTEHLLFGVKGNPRSKFKGKHGATGMSWSTLVYAKRTEHSRKPEIFYKMIEDVSEPPRLELFARRKRPGWDVWGNEIKSDIDLSIP